ncbi:MAG: hypothetical protein U0Q11_10320 [Vicinamibacterales bacterium]
METADQFVDDLVALARSRGTERAKRAADVLAKWDRAADNASDGMLLFYKFMLEAHSDFGAIGGFAIPTDDRSHSPTPRVALPSGGRGGARLESRVRSKGCGRLNVPWGEVMRFGAVISMCLATAHHRRSAPFVRSTRVHL